MTDGVIADKDIRDAFFDEVYEIGSRDKSVIIMSNDMDVVGLQRFKGNFPDRFINVGVAEQNMINVAAGLASCGKKPLVYGITSFVSLRCYEQIKFNLCSMKLPVVIVGMGTGFSFGFDGPTHHAIHDIGAIRVLPEIEILNPSDAVSAARFAHLAFGVTKPVYIRIDKGVVPALHSTDEDYSAGFKLLRKGGETCIVSTGNLSHEAVKFVDSIDESVAVVDVYRLKPINKLFLHRLLDRFSRIIVFEENAGALSTIVSEIIAKYSISCRFKSVSLKNKEYLYYGDRAWFQDYFGINKSNLLKVLDSCAYD